MLSVRAFSLYVLYISLLLSLLAASSCRPGGGGAAASSAEEQAKEVLTLYTYRHLAVDDSLYQRYQLLTGIRVELLHAEPEVLLRQIRQGGSSADVLILPEVAMAIRAKEEGLLQTCVLPGLEKYFKDALRDDYGYWTGLAIQYPIIAYREDLVNPGRLESFFDLGDPYWKGQVLAPAADDPHLQSLVASFVAKNGEEATRQWVESVARNFARQPQGNGLDQLKALGAGLGKLAIANAGDLGYLRYPQSHEELKLGENIRHILPSNQGFNHINVSCAVVPKNGDARKAARFIEYLTSGIVQEIYPAAAHENPVNVMGLMSQFVVEEIGNVQEDPLSLNLLAHYNRQAIAILKEAGW
jgi:iron(III) transport system substrate-binding protein